MADLKIVIVNAHWNNRGDEAALMSLLNFLLDCGCKKITILFKNNGEIYQFPEYERLSAMNAKFVIYPKEFGKYYKNPDAIVDENIRRTHDCVKDSDMVIYSPGGSVISDRFFWRKQLEYLLPIAFAKKYGKPVFVAAPSFGPYFERHVLRKYFLSYPDVICVREHYSYEYLKNIGITSEVYKTRDLAFSSDINPQEEKKIFLDSAEGKFFDQYMKKYPVAVGMTVTDLSWHVEYGKNKAQWHDLILKTFREMIDFLISKGYGIVLIPQLFGNENDSDLLKNFLSDQIYLLPDCFDYKIQQYVIGRLYCVVGMRYHSCIFAAKVGTPFIPVVYEEKLQGFVDETDLKKYSLPVSELSVGELKKKFELLEKNYQSYRAYLKKMHPIWQDEANVTKNLLSPELQKISRNNRYEKFRVSRFFNYWNDLVRMKKRLEECGVNFIFVQTPLKQNIENLSDFEKDRLENWTFDFNNIEEKDIQLIARIYKPNLDRTFFSDMEREGRNESRKNRRYESSNPEDIKNFLSYLKQVYDGAKIYESNGIKYLADFKSEYVNIVNGHRITYYQPDNFERVIYVFGQCTARGTGVEDKHTITSFLQQKINQSDMKGVRVENMALGCGSDIHDDIFHVEHTELKTGDLVIFLTNLEIVPDELFEQENILRIDTSVIFNRPHDLGEWFTDMTFHTNRFGNEAIANFIFDNPDFQTALSKKNSAIHISTAEKNDPNPLEKIINEKNFSDWLSELSANKKPGRNGCIVMNANPFTLGHLYLVEHAKQFVDNLYVFVVEEDKSFFSFDERFQLVKEGLKDKNNVDVLPGGNFIISAVTFPGYFLKDGNKEINVDVTSDVMIFAKYIAPALNIVVRFVGEEPFDYVTRTYNDEMRKIFPKYGIELSEIPRKEENGVAISASEVRKFLLEGNYKSAKKFLPETTYKYLEEKYGK